MATIVLHGEMAEDSPRTTAATQGAAPKEALEMYDSFSAGSIYYGRSIAVVVVATALAVLFNLI